MTTAVQAHLLGQDQSDSDEENDPSKYPEAMDQSDLALRELFTEL